VVTGWGKYFAKPIVSPGERERERRIVSCREGNTGSTISEQTTDWKCGDFSERMLCAAMPNLDTRFYLYFIVFTFPKSEENPKENVEDKNLLRKYRVQYFQSMKTKSIKISKNGKKKLLPCGTGEHVVSCFHVQGRM